MRGISGTKCFIYIRPLRDTKHFTKHCATCLLSKLACYVRSTLGRYLIPSHIIHQHVAVGKPLHTSYARGPINSPTKHLHQPRPRFLATHSQHYLLCRVDISESNSLSRHASRYVRWRRKAFSDSTIRMAENTSKQRPRGMADSAQSDNCSLQL